MAFPVLGIPRPQFLDSNGDPLVSGTLEIDDPTTSSNKSTYPTAADADAASNANAADLTLNASGMPAVDIWGVNGQEYKITVKNAAGTTLNSYTHIAWDQSIVKQTNFQFTRTDAETAASITDYVAGVTTVGNIVNPQYPPGNILRYGADSTGVADSKVALQNAINQASFITTDADDYAGKLVFVPAGKYKITGPIYFHHDSSLNANFSQVATSAGRMTVQGEGRNHTRQVVDDATLGSVLNFTATSADQMIIGWDLSATRPSAYDSDTAFDMVNLKDLAIRGVTTGSLIKMSHNVLGQIHHVVIYNNAANSIGVEQEYSWGMEWVDVWVLGPAWRASATGTGTGMLLTGRLGDSGGGGTNWYQNVNVNGWSTGMMIGREFAETDLGYPRAWNLDQCQFSYCDVGLHLRQGAIEVSLTRCWWEKNAQSSGSTHVDLLITDGAGYDSTDIAFPGESGRILVGPGCTMGSSDAGGDLAAHIQLGQNTGTLEQDYHGHVYIEGLYIPYGPSDNERPYIKIWNKKGNGTLTLDGIQPHSQGQRNIVEFANLEYGDLKAPYSPIVIKGDKSGWLENNNKTRWIGDDDGDTVYEQYTGQNTDFIAYIPSSGAGSGAITMDYSNSASMPKIIVSGVANGETQIIKLPANDRRIRRNSQRTLILKDSASTGTITIVANSNQEWTGSTEYIPEEYVVNSSGVLYSFDSRVSDPVADYPVTSASSGGPVHTSGTSATGDAGINWKFEAGGVYQINGADSVLFSHEYAVIQVVNMADNGEPNWSATVLGGKQQAFINDSTGSGDDQTTINLILDALIAYGVIASS